MHVKTGKFLCSTSAFHVGLMKVVLTEDCGERASMDTWTVCEV